MPATDFISATQIFDRKFGQPPPDLPPRPSLAKDSETGRTSHPPSSFYLALSATSHHHQQHHFRRIAPLATSHTPASFDVSTPRAWHPLKALTHYVSTLTASSKVEVLQGTSNMSSEQINGVATRSLPKKRNPLLAPGKTPARTLQPATSVRRALLIALVDDELIKKRRLGQTTLTVKPGLVGTSNSTKPENLGPFDYAHLRAPLPENLKGSEIFAPHANQSTPEVYFLMVRPITRF